MTSTPTEGWTERFLSRHMGWLHRSPHVKSSILAGAGGAITQLGPMVIFVVLSRTLPGVAVGAYRQITLIQAITLIAFPLGMPTAMLYRLGRTGTDADRADVYGTTFLWMGVCTPLCAIANFLLVNAAGQLFHSPLLGDNAALAGLAGGFGVHSIFIAPLLLSRNGALKYVAFTSAQALLLLFLAWLLISRHPNVSSALQAATIVFALGWLTTAMCFYRAARGAQMRDWLKQLLADLRYAAPIGVSSALYTISHQTDHFVASRFLSPSTYAYYAGGAWQLPVGPLIQRAQADVLTSTLSGHHASGRTSEFWTDWRRVLIPFAVLGAVLFWAVIPIAQDVILTTIGAAFLPSTLVFIIYTLPLPLRMTAFATPLRAAGVTSLDVFGCVAFGLVNFSVGWLLVGRIGLAGPALGLFAGYLTWIAINLWGTAYILDARLTDILPLKAATTSFVVVATLALPAWLVTHIMFSSGGFLRAVTYLALYGFLLAIAYGVRGHALVRPILSALNI